MFTITKQFTFSASHILKGLPENHPCGRLHGHNYTVEMVLSSHGLDRHGFVRDYGELSVVADWLKKNWDHKHLNARMQDSEAAPDGFVFLEQQPSAENLAHFLFLRFKLEFPELVAVRVSETPKTWAEFRP